MGVRGACASVRACLYARVCLGVMQWLFVRLFRLFHGISVTVTYSDGSINMCQKSFDLSRFLVACIHIIAKHLPGLAVSENKVYSFSSVKKGK